MLLHQGIPLTQFISCPICLKVFNEKEYRPISLACGHTVCKSCTQGKLGEKKCPFDKLPFPADVDKLPANYALMQVIGAAIPEKDRETTASSPDAPKSYQQARQYIEEMAVHLKPLAENSSDDESNPSAPSASSLMSEKLVSKCVLSRPIQRKLISLIHCQLLEEEGRSRSARITRSIGERVVTELLSLQQYPQQLSANLWAAVRTRGCQFLGPAMQEEVLKLILLALEDGSFLSRKVLVLFVVQRLELRYPQASKTAIGHVVQLLYRASCFRVMKRDEASSLMQLKDEFRQYEVLRREHDAQIVQIAMEAGLRIPPEHWSSLLYGDSAHKSHMQSIIDKHQSSQSFVQCITELGLNLQRNGDPCDLLKLQPQLEYLSSIDPSPDCPAPSWENLEAVMRSLNTVMTAFIVFLSGPDYRMRLESMAVPNTRYKTSMCRDYMAKSMCPRGGSCTFAHSQDELERHRVRSRRSGKKGENGEKSDDLQDQFFSQLKLSLSDDESSSSSTSSSSNVNMPFSGYSDFSASFEQSYTVPTSMTGTSTHSTAPCPSASRSQTLMSHYRSSPPPLPPTAALLSTNNMPPPDTFASTAQFMPTTRLTFSKPAKEVPELPPYPPLGPQTCMHPHNPTLAGHAGPGCAFIPPRFQSPHLLHTRQQWLDPNGMAGQPAFIRPLDGQAPVPFQSHPHQPHHHHHLPPAGVPVDQYGIGLPPMEYPPCTGCQPPLAHWPQHAFDPAALQSVSEAGQMIPNGVAQEISLEALTSRKNEIITHLQEEPTFLDPMAQVYRADSAKGGFDGLKTVLGNNMLKRDAMPKLVSDMFVATRSTKSLDMLMYENSPVYQTRWSTGEDVVHSNDQELDSTASASNGYQKERKRMDTTSSSSTSSSSYSFSSAYDVPHSTQHTNNFNQLPDADKECSDAQFYDSLSGSMKCSEAMQSQRSSNGKIVSSDAEFSIFPNDDDNESFIPFEHTSVSRFGPISRMAKAKTYNCAPVQVTADSSKRLTPVLAMTPNEGPLPTSMALTSRFSSTLTTVNIVMAGSAVKPSPTETPSIWQESPKPSYMNIARLKAGAAGAISNNERLAYELQAVELEISMKTGTVPETVGKIIQKAVMGNLPSSSAKENSGRYPTARKQYSSNGNSSAYPTAQSNNQECMMGHGHVTDCLTMIEHGKSIVSSEMAAQHIMEEYYRSHGFKK